MIRMPGIRARVLGLAILPVAVIGSVLLFHLIAGKIADLDQALRERAASMARQLAPATEYGVSSGNLEVLRAVIAKAAVEPDVQGVAVFSERGETLAQAGVGRWVEAGPPTRPGGQMREIEFADHLVYYVPIVRTEVEVDDFLAVGSRSRAATRAVPRVIGWVGLDVSRNATLQSQRDAVLRAVGILLAGLVASFLLAWWLGRQITRPILSLAHTVSRIGEGHLDTRGPVHESAEFGVLQRGVNSMAAHLQSMHEGMQERIDQVTARLVYQASHDSLTGLINRREFEHRLERALASALQQGREHVLCYMDLDQFKVINDTSGHGAGDELLRQLALLLKCDLRERDTLARLGGDEFALLLENCSLADALGVAEKMRSEVQRFRFKWEERVFSVGMSIGVVQIDATSESIAALMSAADAACYVAKDRGRNQIHVYEPRDGDLVRHRSEMQWVTRIHEALENGQLHLYWQELVRVDGVRDGYRHVELLLRMKGEDGVQILPMAFIPAAERYLIMPALDGWVVEQALAVCKRYMADATGTHCLFAINLSGASLKDPQFRRVLLDALRAQPEAGPHLCFEITETAAIGNFIVVNGFIEAMREFGCRFALDDFGSGLSSFTYLKNLKVDYLKIDGAFVRDLADNALDRSMVEAIHRIGHQMGLVTVAEYVESAAILAALRAIGVDYAQGNFLHAPQPLETLCGGAGAQPG